MTTLNTMTFALLFSKNGTIFRISGGLIQKLAEKAVNKNTVKTTKTWMNIQKSWAESKGLNEDIVKYEAKEPDKCLSQFFAKICKSDGSDYEPDSIRVMLAALDRHLKYNYSKNHSKGPRIHPVQTGPGGKSKSSLQKRPWKTNKCNKSTYHSR